MIYYVCIWHVFLVLSFSKHYGRFSCLFFYKIETLSDKYIWECQSLSILYNAKKRSFGYLTIGEHLYDTENVVLLNKIVSFGLSPNPAQICFAAVTELITSKIHFRRQFVVIWVGLQKVLHKIYFLIDIIFTIYFGINILVSMLKPSRVSGQSFLEH